MALLAAHGIRSDRIETGLAVRFEVYDHETKSGTLERASDFVAKGGVEQAIELAYAEFNAGDLAVVANPELVES